MDDLDRELKIEEAAEAIELALLSMDPETVELILIDCTSTGG